MLISKVNGILTKRPRKIVDEEETIKLATDSLAAVYHSVIGGGGAALSRKLRSTVEGVITSQKQLYWESGTGL